MRGEVNMRNKIVATKTDLYWGYIKGDILEIVSCYGNGKTVTAKNLTNPNLSRRCNGNSYIRFDEFEIYNEQKHAEYSVAEIQTFKILGIPVWKKIIKVLNKVVNNSK